MDWKGFCGTGCLAACAPLLAKERVDENTLVTASNEDLVQMVGLTQQQAGALQLRVLLLRARDLALAIEKGDALEQRFGSLDALLLLFAAPDILKAALRNNVGLTFGDLSAVMRALEAAHPAAKAAPLRREPPPPPVVAHAAAAHNGGGGASPAHARAPGSKAKAAAEPEEEDDDDAAAASPAAKKSRPKKHPDAPKRSRSACACFYLPVCTRFPASHARLRVSHPPPSPLQTCGFWTGIGRSRLRYTARPGTRPSRCR